VNIRSRGQQRYDHIGTVACSGDLSNGQEEEARSCLFGNKRMIEKGKQ